MPSSDQVIGRADAGQHQQLRRCDAAGADDCLPAEDRKHVSAALDFDSDGGSSLEQHPPRQHVAAYRQVEAMARCGQVGKGAAHANAGGVVHGRGANSLRGRMVHVHVLGIAQARAGLQESVLEGMPGGARRANHGHRPIAAVKIVLHVGVRFQLAEEGQDVVVGPLVVSLGGPVVVVLGKAAQEHLSVDGAGTAHDAPPGDLDWLGLPVGGDGLVGPVEGRARRGCLLAGAVAEFGRPLLEVGVIGAGLQQKNRARRVFGQPGGQRATGGATADDYHVVLHVITKWVILPRR